MAVTLAQLKQRVRDNVYGSYPTNHPFVSVLGAAVANGTTTSITVADGTNWAEGDILEIEETDEQCYVRSVASNVCTVIRGWNGTTAAAAADAGAIRKNPRFSKQQITDSINSTVAALAMWGIHGFGTGSIAYDATKNFHELSETDIDETYGILGVYYVQDNTLIPRPLPYRSAYFNLSTAHASYSQGRGITLGDWGEVTTGESVYFTYAQALTATTLSDAQAELVVLGASALVLGKSIIPRTQDPGARTDRTVQAGQEARDGRWFQAEFFIRARAEAAQCAVKRANVPGSVQTMRAVRWRA